MNVGKGWNAALGIMLLLVSQVAFAGGAGAVRKQIEASMLVTGKIQVDAEGHVVGHSLDEWEKLPAAVVELIDKAAPSWLFKPTLRDGKPVRVTSAMSIRIVARKLEGDQYEVAIRGATFGAPVTDSPADTRALDMSPPDYPMAAAQARVTGTVYLLVRVDRDGKASDVIAEQTNLKIVANDNVMSRWRGLLEDVSVRQARKWKFAPPTQGEDAASDFWIVRVPVVYSLDDSKKGGEAYGSWEAYVPGPRQPCPWDDHHEEGAGFSPDALAPGGIYLAGSGLKLLTDPSGS